MIRRGVVPVAALFVLLVVGPAQAGTCQIGGFNPHETVGQLSGEMIAVQGLGFSSVAGVIVELRAPGDEAIIGVLPFVEEISGTKHQGIVTIPVDYPPGEWEISLQGARCEALSTYVVLEPLNTELAPVDATDDDPTVATFAGPASPPTSAAVGEVVPSVPVPTSIVGPAPVTETIADDVAPDILVAQSESEQDDDSSPVLLVLLGAVGGAGLLAAGVFMGARGDSGESWMTTHRNSLALVGLGALVFLIGLWIGGAF